MSETPELDRLSQQKAVYNALMEFMEEFLPGEQITLYEHRTGLTDLRVCSGPRGGWMDLCPWKEDPEHAYCSKCENTGIYEIEIEDRDLPYAGNRQDLVYQFLGLDPKKIEAERRTILADLQRRAEG